MLQINDISFSYNSEKPVLEKINFSLQKGTHLCIMGESGCGKSTLLKIIYGLLDVNKGSLFWNNNQILGPKFHLITGMPFFKFVSQEFDLMPFTTVSENVAHYLSRSQPVESKKRIMELLEIMEMTSFAQEKVKNLSGGQQQRVAIAKALADEPNLILLDEPFSQIDNFKKNTLRRLLFSYLKEKNISCIVATHDAEDALSYSDKLIVIQNHLIIAKGSPIEIYKNTENSYVASLFDDVNDIILSDKRLLLYPHQIKIVEKSALKATVIKSYFKGFYWLIEVRFNNQIIYLTHHELITELKDVYLAFEKFDGHHLGFNKSMTP